MPARIPAPCAAAICRAAPESLQLTFSVTVIEANATASARTQAFQAEAAKHAVSADAPLPKLPAKEASVTTLAWGTGETVVVLVVMVAGHRLSGRLARNRARAAAR